MQWVETEKLPSSDRKNQMSRLDSFIRRMLAQRACLNWAAAAVTGIAGPVLELGLGNGRTYDHLREILPEREIYVFERDVRCHALSLPPDRYLIVGDIEKTLISDADRLPGKAALAHVDMGTSDAMAYAELALRIGRLLKPLMGANGIIVSNAALQESGMFSLEMPPEVKPGRYFIYRVGPDL
jgi:SAM-dependent methyltransferase